MHKRDAGSVPDQSGEDEQLDDYDWSDPDRMPESRPPGTCDWGDCDSVATRWRWSDDHFGWLPVCDYHDLNDV